MHAPLQLPLEFEAFYLGHQEFFHDYAEAQLGSRRVAEEAIHQAFREIQAGWEQLLREGNLEQRAWTVVRRIVGRRLETEGRPPAFVINGPIALALRAARNKLKVMQSVSGLYEAIAELPPRQFDVMVLRYILGYPPARIAWFMGLTERTVDYHCRKAKERLRVQLGYPGPEAKEGKGK
ncbi:sigma-70 family RNA polymerase sigma factor [Streptomyces sp. ME19-01-6]|uniref:RNA polymerase sigma factor n=1 Tax=Streptomyces sp. ME19-01-6 TaxID=3028686 RepID=UPI0029AF29D1|nr:sigma-70 family RNA polymerase sigma factor [Streptomyces sp. ME19-01-6]MDX3232553.1 sigma-70 family RNA polymerase sigma factor [Streptomyces sp. ME19-01-6]